jgi:hypothetical protein
MVGAFMADVMINIWKIDPTQAPRMSWLITNALVALSDLNLQLPDVVPWLTDQPWREKLLPLLRHQGVRDYWEKQFPKKEKEIQEWISPALNKLQPLFFDSRVKHCLSGSSSLTCRQIMDHQLIFLVHIPKGLLGEQGASLVGALLVALMQKAALSRADVQGTDQERPPYILCLDEFQHYATSSIEDVLTGARKYGLALLLANQFITQIKDKVVRDAVINTAGTIVSFRVDYDDGKRLAPKIFPSPEFPLPNGELPLALGWEGLALELANLPDRVYWLRKRGPYSPARHLTPDMPDPIITPQIQAGLEELLAASAQRWRERSGPHPLKERQPKVKTELVVTASSRSATLTNNAPEDDLPESGAADPQGTHEGDWWEEVAD